MAAAELINHATMINTGDNAWILISSALVLLMTPGLSLFYAGLVPSRSAINTMNMSFICLAVIPIVWVLIGYSLAFAPGNSIIGNFQYALLQNVSSAVRPGTTIPEYDPMIFQMMFAIVTPALISGALVGRMKFKAYIVFVCLWSLLVYSTVAHWVWSSTGWLSQLGALDFAGGTVVHINAGFSALVSTIMLSNPRKKELNIDDVPHNVPFVILGGSLLWFGWFGFNAGSAGSANGIASLAFTTTALAASSAVFAWMVICILRNQPITAVGSAIAVVIGLVAITPASGYVSPASALFIGAIASAICYYAILYKSKIIGKVDDPLDVFICHGISGVVGSLMTGVFASKLANPAGANGLIYGNYDLFITQCIAVVATILLCTTGTAVILFVLKHVMQIDANQSNDTVSLDVLEHGESAYELNTIVQELYESKKNLQSTNQKLTEEITERKRIESKAAALNSQLVVAARRAGMTDIATSVLHNIGNVLNSINTSIGIIQETLKKSEIKNLSKLRDILNPYQENPAEFFTKDKRADNVIKYIILTATNWETDEKGIIDEVKSLEKNILHIKNIITMQQSLSSAIGVLEQTNVEDLIIDALSLNKTAYERGAIEIEKDFSPLKKVTIDRVKLLQIIVNLIKNSIDSLLESSNENKKLIIRTEDVDHQFKITITDNGKGILPENMKKIFSYGFTTKKNGHGFGLHTSALSAQEMGGNLNVQSDGLQKGATFILILPYEPVIKGEKNAASKHEALVDS